MSFSSDLAYHIETWGCQMNCHDSERIAGILEAEGFVKAENGENADIILLNTCSVREKAASKVFDRLGRLRVLKKSKPGMLICVCGCVAQQEGSNILKRVPYVDIVMGTRSIKNLPSLVRRCLNTGERVIDIEEYEDCVDFESSKIKRVSSEKAFITIMEGCNNFCSYCIVPYTRGREVSRPWNLLKEEISCLALEGVKEIQFLGQNVNAYSYDGKELADLLEFASQEDGIKRIRFITSHPAFFNDRLIDVMAGSEKVCRALHLPAQSGSSKVLKLMRRKYSREHYLELVGKIKKSIPDISLSTDMIVGFPGEEDCDFEDSLSLLSEVGYDWMYSFRYSPRSGTKAATMLNQVAEVVKAERLDIIQSFQKNIQKQRFARKVGSVERVLVEGPSRRGEGSVLGRNDANISVNFEGSLSLVGKVVRVKITEAFSNSLRGKLDSK